MFNEPQQRSVFARVDADEVVRVPDLDQAERGAERKAPVLPPVEIGATPTCLRVTLALLVVISLVLVVLCSVLVSNTSALRNDRHHEPRAADRFEHDRATARRHDAIVLARQLHFEIEHADDVAALETLDRRKHDKRDDERALLKPP